MFTPIPVNVSSWTLASVEAAVAAHEDGEFAKSGCLADWIKRDDRIFATLESRTLGVLGLPFNIVPGADTKRKGDAAKLAAEVELWWEKRVPQKTTASAMDWVHLMGFAIAEASFEYDEATDRMQVARIHVHHPQFTRWDHIKQSFQAFTANGWETVTPGDGRWLLFAKQSERPWMAGAIRSLGVVAILRGQSRSDWAGRAEIEATGIRKAKIPGPGDGISTAAPNESDVQAFLKAIRKLGARGLLRLPPGFDLEIAAVDGNASLVFEKLIIHCEAAITLTLLGQNLTTQAEGGSYAAAGVHARVLLDRIKADVVLLQAALGELLTTWCQLNVSRFEDGIVPAAKWNPAPPEDLQKTAQAMLTIAQAVKGLREQNVDVSPLLEKNGLRSLTVGGSAEKPPIFAYHLNAGVLTINEVRATLGLEPVPWGEARTTATPQAAEPVDAPPPPAAEPAETP